MTLTKMVRNSTRWNLIVSKSSGLRSSIRWSSHTGTIAAKSVTFLPHPRWGNKITSAVQLGYFVQPRRHTPPTTRHLLQASQPGATEQHTYFPSFRGAHRTVWWGALLAPSPFGVLRRTPQPSVAQAPPSVP